MVLEIIQGEIPTLVIDILKVVTIILIALIVDRIIVKKAKTIAAKLRVPVEVIKGIITFFRFILLAIVLITLATVQLLPSEYFVGTGALIGTAIGIGASRYVSNYASGAYILMSGLFRVGDYVKIGSNEGIIIDVSINYTKIKKEDGTIVALSNKGILDTPIINFRVEEDDKEYYLYPIRTIFDLKLTHDKILAILEEIIREFKDKTIEIYYEIIELTRNEAKIDIIIKVDEPEKIPQLKSEILSWILKRTASGS